jgi:hypothetical protein
MEWRAIPDYPGYEVSKRGTMRNAKSGYIYGTNCCLKVGGRQKWVNGPKLARIAFAEPAGADLPPVPSPFASAPAPDTSCHSERSEESNDVDSPPAPDADPAMKAMQEMLDKTRRSLAAARRVNGHALALIEQQRAEIKRLAAAGKRRGRKAGKPATDEDQDIDLAALRFEDIDGEVMW